MNNKTELVVDKSSSAELICALATDKRARAIARVAGGVAGGALSGVKT